MELLKSLFGDTGCGSGSTSIVLHNKRQRYKGYAHNKSSKQYNISDVPQKIKTRKFNSLLEDCRWCLGCTAEGKRLSSIYVLSIYRDKTLNLPIAPPTTAGLVAGNKVHITSLAKMSSFSKYENQ